MITLDPNSRLYLAFAFGVGIGFVGAANALFKPSRRAQVFVGLAGSALAAATIHEFNPGHMAPVGASVALVALVWQLSRHANVSLLATRVVSLFHIERFRWATLAMVGAALLVVELVRFDASEEARADADLNTLMMETFNAPASEDLSAIAHTDAGAMVPLVRTIEKRSAEDMAGAEEAALNRSPHRNQLIKRSAADDQCNCHGWVFTGGQYGIHGRDVDRILRENRYTKVIEPQIGDLCVYRGSEGEVLHSSVVRAVCPDGTVLVEGKWGWMGVYLHPASQSCYGDNYRFFHSDRNGHVLSGLDTPPRNGQKFAALIQH